MECHPANNTTSSSPSIPSNDSSIQMSALLHGWWDSRNYESWYSWVWAWIPWIPKFQSIPIPMSTHTHDPWWVIHTHAFPYHFCCFDWSLSEKPILTEPAVWCLDPFTFQDWKLIMNCNGLDFKSIDHYSSTPEHRTRCLTCLACSAVCFQFNQGTIDLCFLSVSLPTCLPRCS